MAVKKQAVKKQLEAPAGNRQAAYSARNRARLIKDAQLVLAEIGPSATIEQAWHTARHLGSCCENG